MLRITTKYYKGTAETNYMGRIKAYSNTGASLETSYAFHMYTEHDAHWRAAYSLAKTLEEDVWDVRPIEEVGNGWLFVVKKKDF